MPVIVADTGPVRYLVMIDAIELLPQLFGRVLIPEIVGAEVGPTRSRLAEPSMPVVACPGKGAEVLRQYSLVQD